jgi:tetratricopeptide (TPR) repeat protein
VAALWYSDGKTAEAHRAIDEVIAKQPAYSQARVIRARFLVAEGKSDLALADAQEAVKVDPQNVEAHFVLGSIRKTNRDLTGAAASFNEVLRLNPGATAAQVQLAGIELQRGEFATATQLADQAVQREPRNLEIRVILTRSLMRRGDLDRATTITREMLDAFPQVGVAHEQAGLLALLKRDRAGARAAFEKALALNPLLVQPLAALAALDQAEGRTDRARARIEERLKRTPGDSDVLVMAAKTWAAAGDQARAEEFLRRAIDADAMNFGAYEMLGQIYVSQNRLDNALAEYSRLAVRLPTAPGPQTMVGIILQAQGKDEEARQRYERLVEAEPRAAVASNNLAWIYASRGEQLDRALQLAQAATAELPDDPAVNDTLGFVYIKKRLPSLAIPPLRLALAKEPANPEFYYHLGLACSQAGDKAAARKALEQALKLRANFAGAEDARKLLRSLE